MLFRSAVPKMVINAFLAAEDKNFYDHNGIDPQGILRAGVAYLQNFGSNRRPQGASTITQQVAKNFLLTNEVSFTRKIKEALLAFKLETVVSKDQILGDYLNTIYFGNGAYGIKAAAERYFNKPVQRLNLPEAAMLAGIVSNPDGFDPITHPVSARARRAKVLEGLVAVGVITQADAQHDDAAPLPTRITPAATYGPNTSFVDAMQHYLIDQDNAASQALGATREARRSRLYRGGLRITTTWDPAIQRALDAAVAAARLDGRLSVSSTVIDNRTGAVRAVYPNLAYGRGVKALAPAVRQPGSTARRRERHNKTHYRKYSKYT